MSIFDRSIRSNSWPYKLPSEIMPIQVGDVYRVTKTQWGGLRQDALVRVRSIIWDTCYVVDLFSRFPYEIKAKSLAPVHPLVLLAIQAPEGARG